MRQLADVGDWQPVTTDLGDDGAVLPRDQQVRELWRDAADRDEPAQLDRYAVADDRRVLRRSASLERRSKFAVVAQMGDDLLRNDLRSPDLRRHVGEPDVGELQVAVDDELLAAVGSAR